MADLSKLVGLFSSALGHAGGAKVREGLVVGRASEWQT